MMGKDEISRYPYSVRYLLNIPQAGGDINGYAKVYMFGQETNCTVIISGTYDGQEGGPVNGTISGECNLVIISGSVQGILQGSVYPSKKYMESTVKGSLGGNNFEEYVWTRFYNL